LQHLAVLAPLVAVTACGGPSRPVALSPDVAAAAGAQGGAAAPSTGRHPFGVDDMLAMERVDDPDVSPDGKLVVFTVSVPDVAANKSKSDVWLAATDGSMTRKLTYDPA